MYVYRAVKQSSCLTYKTESIPPTSFSSNFTIILSLNEGGRCMEGNKWEVEEVKLHSSPSFFTHDDITNYSIVCINI